MCVDRERGNRKQANTETDDLTKGKETSMSSIFLLFYVLTSLRRTARVRKRLDERGRKEDDDTGGEIKK